MDITQRLFLQVLINYAFEGESARIAGFLPANLLQQIQKEATHASDVTPLIRPFKERVRPIHYSWFIEPLEELPELARRAHLSRFPKTHKEKLSTYLHLKPLPLPPPPFRSLVLAAKFPKLNWHFPFPSEYLEENPLSPLISLSKKKLVELIDFSGLYDLAEEIHQIVDKQLLEKIYRCLTRKQHRFLSGCLHQRQKLLPHRLHIEHWDGDRKKLTRLIHNRGLLRLGNALSGQPLHFVNAVVYTLDRGRGKKVLENWQKDPIEGISPHLVQQTLRVLKFFSKEGVPHER